MDTDTDTALPPLDQLYYAPLFTSLFTASITCWLHRSLPIAFFHFVTAHCWPVPQSPVFLLRIVSWRMSECRWVCFAPLAHHTHVNPPDTPCRQPTIPPSPPMGPVCSSWIWTQPHLPLGFNCGWCLTCYPWGGLSPSLWAHCGHPEDSTAW